VGTVSRIRIGDREVGQDCPCLVVAEIGVNHNGDPRLAAEMIDAIAKSGAECVKFQTFTADEFVSDGNEIYSYISQGQEVSEPMLEMFRRLEIGRGELPALFARARNAGLIAMSTPADRAAVDLLDDLGVPAFKIGSDDLVYTPFIEYVASKGKPVIISTGMADESDIERAVTTILGAGNSQIVILHCVSEYPTPPSDVNLNKILTLKERFGFPVGFSDHTFGISASVGAVVLGACVIEKHFTLDRTLPGPDHRFSADPLELERLVRNVGEVQMCLGASELEPTAAERDMAKLCRRSIVAARTLEAGHTISFDDLAFRRPGTGLLPYELDEVIGKVTRDKVGAGTAITLDLFEDVV
jgi:N,N'-diacetyllegionaminate synthase